MLALAMKKIALLGAAHIHTPGFMKRFAQRETIILSHVWDHDRTRRARWAREMKANAIATPAEALSDPDVAAVIVCSETVHHEALVVAAAEAGKAIFAEKPLGMAAGDARRMADAVERHRVVFQTGYFQRGLPAHQFIAARIADGSLGTITRARVSNCHAGASLGWFDTEWRWMADPAQAGVGAFGDMGAHALDLLMWWLGPVAAASSALGIAMDRYGCDEYGEGLLRFRSGAVATLAAGWVDVANPVTALVSGTRGHITVSEGKVWLKREGDDAAQEAALPAPQPAGFDLFLDWLEGKADTAGFVSARACAERNAAMDMLYQNPLPRAA